MNSSDEIRSSFRSITWVTADYFVDCDFNTCLLSKILSKYNIHWIIILPKTKQRYTADSFKTLSNLNGLKIELFYKETRDRNFQMLFFYTSIFRRIEFLSSDIVYLNDTPTNPYVLSLYLRLNKMNLITTVHDGAVNKNFKFSTLAKSVFYLAYKKVKYIHGYSQMQIELFKRQFEPKKSYYIPLLLKDFGKPETKRSDNIVTFTFFGAINDNKNLKILIEAACSLFEEGFSSFKVVICGQCNDWSVYENCIKFPQIFECDIRFFENSEIPDIFGRSHYAIFPYKEVSQSGALKVAFNYNIPVIVSDLDPFKAEVENNRNGYIFQSNNVLDLKNVLRSRLEFHSDYEQLLKSVSDYNVRYSSNVIADKYVQMFDDVYMNKNNGS